MDVTAVVLFRSALAHYTVTMNEDGSYEAGLQKYAGTRDNDPPLVVHFKKEGRHCTGDSEEKELMDDLCYAVQAELTKGGGSLGSEQRPRTPYVSI